QHFQTPTPPTTEFPDPNTTNNKISRPHHQHFQTPTSIFPDPHIHISRPQHHQQQNFQTPPPTFPDPTYIHISRPPPPQHFQEKDLNNNISITQHF
ncbi:hypothetical protein Pcinc_043794, partial [Petrolisthes cinctipes]